MDAKNSFHRSDSSGGYSHSLVLRMTFFFFLWTTLLQSETTARGTVTIQCAINQAYYDDVVKNGFPEVTGLEGNKFDDGTSCGNGEHDSTAAWTAEQKREFEQIYDDNFESKCHTPLPNPDVPKLTKLATERYGNRCKSGICRFVKLSGLLCGKTETTGKSKSGSIQVKSVIFPLIFIGFCIFQCKMIS